MISDDDNNQEKQGMCLLFLHISAFFNFCCLRYILVILFPTFPSLFFSLLLLTCCLCFFFYFYFFESCSLFSDYKIHSSHPPNYFLTHSLSRNLPSNILASYSGIILFFKTFLFFPSPPKTFPLPPSCFQLSFSSLAVRTQVVFHCANTHTHWSTFYPLHLTPSSLPSSSFSPFLSFLSMPLLPLLYCRPHRCQ